MRLRALRDVYLNQDIYIVGSGPTANVFPLDFLRDKVCMGLNDSYKIHPAIKPLAFFHHEVYAHTSSDPLAPFHPHFERIKYPIVKATGRTREETVDWDHPHYYYFDWSHRIEDIWTITRETDVLYYTPEGCSLHGALQVAWILGARNIFLLGCDSRVMGGKHYASFDKNGIRADEVLKRGVQRNYDSYVYGTLLVLEFLRRKGISVFNLSPLVGYHLVDYQYEVLRGNVPMSEVLAEVDKLKEGAVDKLKEQAAP